MIYFASGSNRPGEIRGFSEVGHAIGVVADEILGSTRALEELLALAGTGIPVFVDSGAFSEVEFGPAGPRVVKPITAADWRARLALYETLAAALGPSLYVVAPDMVGFPDETLERLETHREALSRIAALGARVLVALQGEDKVEFWHRVLELNLAPTDSLVPALPMKKNATTDEGVLDFARMCRPGAVHLLGLGAANRRAPALVEALERSGIEVSLDSNLIRANVGRGRNPRKLTRAIGVVADEILGYAFAEGAPAGAMGSACDYTDSIADPADWITPKLSRQVADELVLTDEDRCRWSHDPAGFLADDVNGEGLARWELPEVSAALDRAWQAAHWQATTPERKRRAIKVAFPKKTDT